MTKAELIEAMADGADISKVAANRALDTMITSITKTLKKNGKVTLVGFGTFSANKRKARKGRNPRTGEIIYVPARRKTHFKAGKILKNELKKETF